MEKTATIKKRNRASLEEGLDGSDEWTPGKEGKEGKETGSKRKQTEASEELDDDVPISKRNKGKDKDASKPCRKPAAEQVSQQASS